MNREILAAMKLPMPERECSFCHKKFAPKRIGGKHKGLFCSRECFNNSRRVRKDCVMCHEKFNAKKKDEKFCSRNCYLQFNQGSNNAAWRGGKEVRNCPICGNEFASFPSINSVTCSDGCYRVHLGLLFSGENNPNWKGGKKIECKACGKEIWKGPNIDKRYCSNECFYKDNFKKTSPRWGSRWGSTAKKSGKRADLGIFVRSSWEANYARYLNFLKKIGDIKDWKYESETFRFNSIQRGTRSYTPDFKITFPSDKIEYHEVKGWKHPKGETAIKRMAKYYPEVKVIVIDQKAYKAIEKVMKNLVPGWE